MFLQLPSASTLCQHNCSHHQLVCMLLVCFWTTAGSIAGGSLVTIQGLGFPSSLDLTSGKSTASIMTTNGTKCRIIESSYNKILCVTEPAQAGTNSSGSRVGVPPGVGVVWPGGLLVGPRGWVYDIFVNNRWPASLLSDADPLSMLPCWLSST